MRNEIFEIIKGRKSIRAYLDKQVPKEFTEKVLGAAMMSPSWGNTQPWEIAVAQGELLRDIKEGYIKAAEEGRETSPDFTFPAFWPDINKERYFNNGQRLYQLLDIKRDDKVARNELKKKGTQFFGAPQVIFLFLDDRLSGWSMMDIGIFAQTIMLTAHSVGLGTCPMAMATIYPDIVREVLGISSNKKLALGIPMGYPDESALINKHRSTRADLGDVLKWYY